MKIKFSFILFICFFLFSCSLPQTKVETGESRPALAIEGAPQNSLIFIDGLMMGLANDYNGSPHVLLIEPGTHELSIKTKGKVVIFSKTIYVESGIKTIAINEK